MMSSHSGGFHVECKSSVESGWAAMRSTSFPSGEVRLEEIRPAEVRPAEVCPDEFRLDEVGLVRFASTRFAPRYQSKIKYLARF